MSVEWRAISQLCSVLRLIDGNNTQIWEVGFAMGITKGFCIHISQAYGKKDYHLVNRGFFVASVLSLIVGTMISIVGSLAIRDFLILMHTPGEILEQSLDYIKVILLGFVITVLNNLFMSVLQSLGDSSTPFCALLVSSITNVGLDCVFVLILKWGVQGAPDVRFSKGEHLWNNNERRMQFEQVAEGSVTLDEFVAQLSDEELAHLLGGQPNTGVANTFGFGNLPECGIPNFMTADGPAGLRILPECGVCTTAPEKTQKDP